jgi:hypothetical protein
VAAGASECASAVPDPDAELQVMSRRCVAQAVTEYERRREPSINNAGTDRLGNLAHELRNTHRRCDAVASRLSKPKACCGTHSSSPVPSHISLKTSSTKDHIWIEVEDQCGGIPPAVYGSTACRQLAVARPFPFPSPARSRAR